MTEAKRQKRKYVRKPVDDGIYWVVSQRKLLSTTPLFVFKSREGAYSAADKLTITNSGALTSFKVDRVDLAV